ncbi:MAG TPA: tautomerase family protein [Gaiellaceae bacterium]|jgi:4-oxalocrotonate tautomerase family enzyme|nr:tautomerase family protein [Gaiellaceae bacterium]
MPTIEVKLYEERLTDELAAELIDKMTEAMVECTSEELRSHTWVIVTAPPARHWGHAGKPGPIAGVTLPSG